jgi:hypothetical protein
MAPNAETASTAGFAIYNIENIADPPARIGREKIEFSGGSAWIDIGAGNEWSRDGIDWSNAVARSGDTAEKWASVLLTRERQTVFVRGAARESLDATRTNLPSMTAVRVNIPPLGAEPRVRLDIARGTLVARQNLEISNNGISWAVIADRAMEIGKEHLLLVPNSTTNRITISLVNGETVYIRTPAATGRPASAAFELEIDIQPIGAVDESHFIVAPRRTITVSNGIDENGRPIVIQSLSGGNWRNIRRLSADKHIPDSGLKVRRAGSNTYLPGPEFLLTLEKQGDRQRIVVAEAPLPTPEAAAQMMGGNS